MWAEQDGQRQVATVTDVCFVVEWQIKLAGRLPYTIGPFPYRLDGTYVSASFGGETRGFVLSSGGEDHCSLVTVEGLPPARVVRRSDWGWELRNHVLMARSLKHDAQDEHVHVQPCGV
jgi:hypothetical protein